MAMRSSLRCTVLRNAIMLPREKDFRFLRGPCFAERAPKRLTRFTLRRSVHGARGVELGPSRNGLAHVRHQNEQALQQVAAAAGRATNAAAGKIRNAADGKATNAAAGKLTNAAAGRPINAAGGWLGNAAGGKLRKRRLALSWHLEVGLRGGQSSSVNRIALCENSYLRSEMATDDV